ncbi:MAG TPA: VOC family protein [Bacteroidia bacterium]|nr:VOC family protein [Bacteroidia bacterium]
MDAKVNTLNWFEIPVSDFERAKKFYETIFDIKMQKMDFGGFTMGMFPSERGNGKLSGAIVHGEYYKPSAEGVLVYLNGNPDLAVALGKVVAAGGKIMRPKTQIGEFGYMAVIFDTEGNAVALHSNN